ncbi:MAG TPA: uracil-DNA glycosylase [Fimbriiglobus sp.]|jgi:DNA polymerase
MADPRRQIRQRLDSLKAAGVEFVPAVPPVPLPVPEPVELSVSNSTLFDATEAAPVGDRGIALDILRHEVSRCEKCPDLFSTRTQTVFGVGPMSAALCFVGEAPGADEDAQGEPFVGRAGQLLNKIIVASGFQREEVYICNTLKCRPPGNRTPAPQECENCRGYFERQIDLVQPQYICALGGVSAQNLLNTKIGITKLRGKVHHYRGIPVVCTFHPAYLLRNPPAKKDCWEDMKFLLGQMGRPVPVLGG